MADRGERRRALAGAAAALAVAALVGWAVIDLPRTAGPLAGRLVERAPETGASNPVTAVLLGFRAYDTWLEVAVLLAAALGALAAVRARDATDRPPPAPEPVLSWMATVIVPAGILGGGLMLWLGTGSPGGAFQAGAVLGAVALLLWLAGTRSPAALPAGALGVPLAAGTAAFAALAGATLAAGSAMLEVPPAAATWLIVAVETAVTVSVAVTLPLVVVAARAGADDTASAAPPAGEGR